MRKTKKGFCLLLAAFLLTGALLIPASATDINAVATKSTIKVNNMPVTMQGYVINGNNYFKLRDLALALNRTTAPFSVTWDGTANSIWLRIKQDYVPVGGEMVLSDSAADLKAVQSTSKVYVNGMLISIAGYVINGNNYFKLRDIGAAMDIGVTYEEETDTVVIDTSLGYYTSNILSILKDAYYNSIYGRIVFSSYEVGNISIDIFNDTSYEITAGNITSDKGVSTLKDVIGVFISQPQTVMDALSASRNEGKKQLQADSKTVECFVLGNKQTIRIDW